MAAIAVAEEALRVAAVPRELGKSLDRLGFLYYTSGGLPEGEKYLRESLQVREAAFGLDSLDYAETANDLARPDRVRRCARRCVPLGPSAPGSLGGLLGCHRQADPNDNSVLIFLPHNMLELDQFAKGIGLGVFGATTQFQALAAAQAGPRHADRVRPHAPCAADRRMV